jgi:mRNA-degrading endonuclease toxin of MazEF toxin-antitoxin module
MNQWDLWTFDFADAGPHPAVIISHPDRIARASMVNVLICSSHRASRPPKENEVLLNGSDGLDWETLVKCDLIYLVEKANLYRKRGSVVPARRRAIVQRINGCLKFTSV